MKIKLGAKAAQRLWKTVYMTAFAVCFASGLAALTARAEPSDAGAKGGEPAHTCPHAKAAAAEGAAAPCEHASDGSCSKCTDAKDCPHAKDGSCSDCGVKESTPESH